MRLRQFFVLITVAGFLVGCGGSGGPMADKPPVADPSVVNAEKGTPKYIPGQNKVKAGAAVEP